MKKLALALIAVLSLLSIAGCTTSPPPPVVTKG
jgi:predicted small lipoprotein YifL